MQEATSIPGVEIEQSAFALGTLAVVAILLLMAVVYVIPFFFIFRKVGWHWATGFLMLVSPVNLILLYVLAFAKWPIEKRLAGAAANNPGSGPPA